MIGTLGASIPVLVPQEFPDIWRLLSLQLQPLPIFPIIAILLATAYVVGVTRVRRSSQWPARRVFFFITGCAALFAITATGIEGYGYALISVFMFQQLTLMMVIPLLLVLGWPGTLLLKSTPSRGRGRWIRLVALRGLRSRTANIALHPGILVALFLFAFYGVYLTGVGTWLLASWWGHFALEVFFLAAGVLFAIPIASRDPLPSRRSPLGKLVSLLVEMPLHAIFGVIVMLATTRLITTGIQSPSNWKIDPLVDQGIAGALAWTYGELPALLLIIVMLARWERDDTRRAQRADRDHGDADLERYNAYLARLQSAPPTSTATPAEIAARKEPE